jgi:hypothetical protein
MGVSLTISVGPRQRSHSQVRVPRDSRLYFTVMTSDLSYDWLLFYNVGTDLQKAPFISYPRKCVKCTLYPWKSVGFPESISMEICLSTRCLAMDLHVTIFYFSRFLMITLTCANFFFALTFVIGLWAVEIERKYAIIQLNLHQHRHHILLVCRAY